MGFGMDEMMGEITGIPGISEYEYDCQLSAQSAGCWRDRDGRNIAYKDMNNQYMRNAIRTARRLAACASCTSDEDRYNEWADDMQQELSLRYIGGGFSTGNTKKPNKVAAKPKAKKPVRGSKVEVTCKCGNKFEARVADRKRGWGKYCSKSCKGIYS